MVERSRSLRTAYRSTARCDTRMESAVGNWSEWLAGTAEGENERRIRDRTYTGRPCGDERFVKQVEAIVGRPLTPQKPGPKPRPKGSGEERLIWTTDDIRSER